MNALREIIAEGEHIRSDVASALETGTKVKSAWNTVVHWYADAFAYAKEHSSRPLNHFDEFLDPSSETSVHYEQIDRLLNRLRGILSSESPG